MDQYNFWNRELNEIEFKNLSGDLDLITKFIYEKTIENLNEKHFIGDLYILTIYVIKTAKELIKTYDIGPIFRTRTEQKKYFKLKDEFVKSFSKSSLIENNEGIELNQESFTKLDKCLNNFLYYNGNLKFKTLEVNNQEINGEDIDYGAIELIANERNIYQNKTKLNNIHSRHPKLEFYKKTIKELFEEIENYQYNSKNLEEIFWITYDYIYHEVVKNTNYNLTLLSEKNDNKPIIWFEEYPNTVFKKRFNNTIPRINLNRYLFVEGKYLYKYFDRKINYKNKHFIQNFELYQRPFTELLEFIREKYKVVLNINRNSILYLTQEALINIPKAEVVYFDFIKDYRVYEPFYLSLI